jgi:hypothetical protein
VFYTQNTRQNLCFFGKKNFAECFLAGTRQSFFYFFPGKIFAECLVTKHSAKGFPVGKNKKTFAECLLKKHSAKFF